MNHNPCAVVLVSTSCSAVGKVQAWFLDYQATGDPAVRERIILAHLRLAARFRGSQSVAGEDLAQAARVGLVAAVDRYDPGRANQFGHPVLPAAAVVGDLVAPPVALAGFFVLAVFYGLTSHGLTGLPAVLRRDPTGD